jgi:hypothetical protein
MNNFLDTHLDAILSTLVTIITLLVARKKEKQSLRKSGNLMDELYFKQNGLSKRHNEKKY